METIELKVVATTKKNTYNKHKSTLLVPEKVECGSGDVKEGQDNYQLLHCENMVTF